MPTAFEEIETSISNFSQKYFAIFARIALFIIFFWFGILKVLGTSAANPLVSKLLAQTLPFITDHDFFIFFGIFEMVIGLCFLIPKLNRLALVLLIPHMFTTFMPLILLPQITWQSFMVPTLEGQYIFKNLIIISCAIGIAANFKTASTKAVSRKK